jgi:hypothetical protein
MLSIISAAAKKAVLLFMKMNNSLLVLEPVQVVVHTAVAPPQSKIGLGTATTATAQF